MKQGALDKQRFERIESYLMETLEAKERERFEEELRNDPNLVQEVELQRENVLAIELGGVTRTLRKVVEEGRTEGGAGGASTGWWRYAAAIALLAAVAAWFLVDRQPTHERLFSEHYATDPGLPVPMSSTDDAAFHDAMVAFKLGDFAEANTKWTALLHNDPTNDTLLYYIANAALANGEVNAAIALLEQVVATPSSVFRNKARWYLFLAHVHTGDVEAKRETDLTDDPVYGERVRAILDELDP